MIALFTEYLFSYRQGSRAGFAGKMGGKFDARSATWKSEFATALLESSKLQTWRGSSLWCKLRGKNMERNLVIDLMGRFFYPKFRTQQLWLLFSLRCGQGGPSFFFLRGGRRELRWFHRNQCVHFPVFFGHDFSFHVISQSSTSPL